MSRIRFLVMAGPAVMSAILPAYAAAQIRVAAYNTETAFNTNGNPNPGLQNVLEGLGNETTNGYAKRLDILCLEEQNNTTGTSTAQILSMMNNLYGAGTYAKGNLIAGATTSPNNDSSAVIYDTTKFTLVAEKLIGTPSGSGQPRQGIRYQFRPIGYSSSSDFYVYVSHLKASGGADNMARRNVEAQAIRADSNTLPAGARIIYAGDYNLTGGTSEPAWATMTASGNGQAIDPFGGSWANVAKTWSTTSLGSRLDFQFQTAPTTDGHGFSLIPGSYRTFANNGSTPSGAPANSASNNAVTGLPNRATVLSSLTTASDHYPVVADYRYPAKMGVSVASVPSQVIVGASVPVNVTVTNTAPVIAAIGADGLDYSVTGSGSLTGSGAGTALMALSPGNVHALFVNTASPGSKLGSVSVTSSSQEVGSGTFSQLVTTEVLDHAHPDLSVATIDFGIRGRTLGGASASFQIANLVGSGPTAGLDLDSITPAGDTTALTSTAAPFTNLAAGTNHAFTARVDDGANGSFSASYTFNFSDQNLLGATALSSKTLVLTGIIATPGDTDLNGTVNFDDYVRTDNGFNNQLTGWSNGDFDSNGVVNFDDYVWIDLFFNEQTGGGRAALLRAQRWLAGESSPKGIDPAVLAVLQNHLAEFGDPYARSFVAAVPEPASLAMAGLAMALGSRRSRRQTRRGETLRTR